MSLFFVAILILGWYYPILGYFIPLCMFMGILIGAVRGRKWCDWYCPRGAFYDIFMKPISRKKNIPWIFKNLYFRLVVLLLLFSAMAFNLARRWPNSDKIGLLFVTIMSITSVLGIVLAVIFHQRSWCMICPVGTLANLIGKNKYPLRINPELCVECKLCAKACPIQIKPYIFKTSKDKAVKEGDCLKCNLCIAACPRKALSR